MQSASKSYVTSLIELAFEHGCLASLDKKLIDYFPEYEAQIKDSR